MATRSQHRTTIVGVCTTADNGVDPGANGDLGSDELVNWELNIVERNPGTNQSWTSDYTVAGDATADTDNQIDRGDALVIMNRVARALHHRLGSNFTTTKVPKITLTVHMKDL